MANKVVVLVCKNAQEVTAARAFLERGGFTPEQIEAIEAKNFSYDGDTYTDQGSADTHVNVSVVIGRR